MKWPARVSLRSECSDLVNFSDNGDFFIVGGRTGTWQIDELGRLIMLHNETGDTQSVISRYSQFDVVNGVHVLNEYRDGRTASHTER